MKDENTNAEQQGANGASEPSPARPRKLHIFMMGKGGVGKSFVASLAMQYYRMHGTGVIGYDLDPVNKTLANVGSLKANEFEILKDSEPPTVDRTKFDDLIDEILKGTSDVIVDTGATTFLPLNSYLTDMELLPALKEFNIETVLHIVLRGGSSTLDCLGGMVSILENYPKGSCQVVAWKNEVEGKIMVDGQEFEELGYYQKRRDRFSHVITIPEMTDDLVIQDLRDLLQRSLTFQEVIDAEDTQFVRRLRYKRSHKIYMEVMAPVLREFQSIQKPIE